jgi:hypothetical protein
MVDVQEFGFDKNRFPKLADESFDCVICSEVVRNPKECTGCGSLFCTPCINSWLSKRKECPNRCNLNTEHIKPIGKALLRMYNELDVKCVHHDKCDKILKLVDLEQHEKTCQLPKCDNFELCANLIRDENNKTGICSQECGLITNLKKADGDWNVMYKELKEFMASSSVQEKPAQILNGSVSLVKGQSFKDEPVSFRWDDKFCGTNIILSDQGFVAYLKENSYVFKTVLGNQAFNEGIHYWEIHADPRTENELKIGIALKKDFEPNSAFCDFEFGYAYYGLGQLRHGSNANGNAYGKKFKKEGVLGVCLNMVKGTLSFSLDGAYFGVAFQNEQFKKGPIWPAVALLHSAGCRLVSGKPVPQYFLK